MNSISLPEKLLLMALRNANYRVALVTDHEQRTISKADADRVAGYGMAEYVTDQVTKEFRTAGKVVRFVTLNESGRLYVDRLVGTYRSNCSLPRLVNGLTTTQVEAALMMAECYQKARPIERTKIRNLLTPNLERFVEVLSTFDTAEQFIDYMRG